jgi:hypothetical protein
MDDRSTPINSLNNSSDDSEVVNNILSKYNNIQQDSASGTLPPLNRNIPQMEDKFENRNLNNEMYNLKGGNNVEYQQHYQTEQKRVAQYNKPDEQYEDDPSEEEYEEYEVIEIPLWKRVLNELRIPLFILIIVLLFSNCYFDKFLITKIPIMGNQFNDCNTYGFIFKAFLISVLSYLLIRFVRV